MSTASPSGPFRTAQGSRLLCNVLSVHNTRVQASAQNNPYRIGIEKANKSQ